MSMTCPLHPTPTIHIETQIELIVVEHMLLSGAPPRRNPMLAMFSKEKCSCISMKTICFTKHAADRADQRICQIGCNQLQYGTPSHAPGVMVT